MWSTAPFSISAALHSCLVGRGVSHLAAGNHRQAHGRKVVRRGQGGGVNGNGCKQRG